MKKSLALTAGVVLAFVASAAFAQNTRPVAIGASAEPTVQSILDVNTGFETLDAALDQSTTALWALDAIGNPPLAGDFPSSITPTIRLEAAGNAGSNQLGLWTNTFEYIVFNGAASVGSVATITWTDIDTISVTGDAGVNVGSYDGITANSFGFFLKRGSDGGNNYSLDSKNTGGAARMLAYSAIGTPANDWIIAFEDLNGGDMDFNDMVFRVSDLVTAVPEPEIYAMMAAGLGLMGFVARRRKRDGTVV